MRHGFRRHRPRVFCMRQIARGWPCAQTIGVRHDDAAPTHLDYAIALQLSHPSARRFQADAQKAADVRPAHGQLEAAILFVEYLGRVFDEEHHALGTVHAAEHELQLFGFLEPLRNVVDQLIKQIGALLRERLDCGPWKNEHARSGQDDESQVTYLEDMMWASGYLDGPQMAGAFQMLRSYDLIWSRITRDYLLGQRRPPNDLMAWNADATRMPFRMHSEYLRGLYLRNDLAEGCWKVDGHAVTVESIAQPWFVVGTETDHVAPWRSVYKIDLLADSDVTFVLTSGGHNAGIVSEPGHPRRHYRWAKHAHDAAFIAPEQWLQQAQVEQGSWWSRWHDWLAIHSSRREAPPQMGTPELAPLAEAPGTYVLQR